MTEDWVGLLSHNLNLASTQQMDKYYLNYKSIQNINWQLWSSALSSARKHNKGFFVLIYQAGRPMPILTF